MFAKGGTSVTVDFTNVVYVSWPRDSMHDYWHMLITHSP